MYVFLMVIIMHLIYQISNVYSKTHEKQYEDKEMQTDGIIQKEMPTSKANENSWPKLSYLVKEINKGRYIPKSRGKRLILYDLPSNEKNCKESKKST